MTGLKYKSQDTGLCGTDTANWRRVFITDDFTEMMPKYLNFVKGQTHIYFVGASSKAEAIKSPFVERQLKKG